MGTRPLARMPAPRPQQGVLDRARGVATLRDLAQRQQIGQAQLQGLEQQNQAYEQEQQEQAKLQRAYMEANGDLEKTIPIAIRMGVSQQRIQNIRETSRKQRQELADLTADKLENFIKTNEIIGGAFQAVLSLPEDQRAQGYGQQTAIDSERDCYRQPSP